MPGVAEDLGGGGGEVDGASHLSALVGLDPKVKTNMVSLLRTVQVWIFQ